MAGRDSAEETDIGFCFRAKNFRTAAADLGGSGTAEGASRRVVVWFYLATLRRAGGRRHIQHAARVGRKSTGRLRRSVTNVGARRDTRRRIA
ncbi:MAG: hypothetical protein ACRD68_17735, partial [Pyrinomonadaceae bacterium]